MSNNTNNKVPRAGLTYSNKGTPYWVSNDGSSCPVEELNSSHLANIYLLLGHNNCPPEIRNELKRRMEIARSKLES